MCTHEKGTCVRCATEKAVEAEARLGERLDSHTAKFFLRNLSNGVPATVDRFDDIQRVIVGRIRKAKKGQALESLRATTNLANGQASLPNEAKPLSDYVAEARAAKIAVARTAQADEFWDKVQEEREVVLA